MAFNWTQEARDTVVALARKGASGAQVAAELMAKFPHGGQLSRSAVIGHCNRNGVKLGGGSYRPSDESVAETASVLAKQWKPKEPRTHQKRAPTPVKSAPSLAPVKPSVSVPMSNAPRAKASGEVGRDGDLRGLAPAPVAVPPDDLSLARAFDGLPKDECVEALPAAHEEYRASLEREFDPLEFVISPHGYFGPTRFIETRDGQCKMFQTKDASYSDLVCGERTEPGLNYCKQHGSKVFTVQGLSAAALKGLSSRRGRQAAQGL